MRNRPEIMIAKSGVDARFFPTVCILGAPCLVRLFWVNR